MQIPWDLEQYSKISSIPSSLCNHLMKAKCPLLNGPFHPLGELGAIIIKLSFRIGTKLKSYK